MAGFSSPFLVLVLALAAVGAMPLDTPEAGVESPDILVLMPTSQTDAPAATPRMLGTDTEDAANLIPGAGDMRVLPSSPSQASDKHKAPEDTPVTPIPPAAGNTSAEAVNKPDPPVSSSTSTEAAPSEAAPSEAAPSEAAPSEAAPSDAGPRPTQRVEEPPVTIMPAESATTEPADAVEEVPASHTPRAEGVSTGAGQHPASSTAPQAAGEAPWTTAPQAAEDISGTTVAPVEKEGPVTSLEAGHDSTASPKAAEPEDVEGATPSVEDAAFTTTVTATEDDTVTTVGPVKEVFAESHSEVGDPAAEADKQSLMFTTELPPQDLDAVANVVVDTVTSTAVPEVSDGVDTLAVTVVVENTDAMVTEAAIATTEEPASHRDAGEGRGRAFDHVLVAGADPSHEAVAQLASTSQAPLPVAEAAIPASSEVPPPASEAPVSVSEGPLPASEAVVPASSEVPPPSSEAPAPVSTGPLPVSEASLPANEEPVMHVSEDPLSSSEAPIPLTNLPDALGDKQKSEDVTAGAARHSHAAALPTAAGEAVPVVRHPEETKPIGVPAPQVETAAPANSELASTASTSTAGAARSVARGGTARPINEGTEEVATKPGGVEASAVIGKPTPASAGRDVLIGSPDCPKMEADARFIVILVLLAALSVLGVSVVVLVMKFRVKPAARRTISMSMCWCLRWGRARRATITPPFAHNDHQRTEAQVGGTKADSGKGTEDYNLASDEDCRRGEQCGGQGAGRGAETQQDMPTWTFYEKGVSAAGRAAAAAGPQSPSSAPDRKQEDEVLSSNM